MNHPEVLKCGRDSLSYCKIPVRKVFIFIAALLLFCIAPVNGQDLISRLQADYPQAVLSSECSTAPYGGCTITLPPAVMGSPYLFTVKLLQPVQNPNVDFLTNPCPGADNLTFTYVPGPPPLINVTIPASRICTATSTSRFIEVQVTVEDAGGGIDTQNFLVPLPRKPVKVALVLDISGSMRLPTPGDLINARRWDVLKVAVNTFMEKFELLRSPFDSVALTYFTTYTIQPSYPTVKNFIEITPHNSPTLSSTIINNDMAPPKDPLYLTAMGLGLLDAKSKLRNNTPSADAANKAVVLFTDGYQNVFPRVDPTGGVNLENGEKLNDCGVSPCTEEQKIRYYTIGIGAINVPEVLTYIAINNYGETRNTTTGEASEFITFFDNTWETMLYTSSPQNVGRKTGYLNAGTASYNFRINRNIRTVIFELISAECDSVEAVIRKDGKVLIPEVTRSSKLHKLLSFRLPAVAENQPVYSEGEWEVSLAGNSARKFMLACFADDHFLKYSIGQNKPSNTVGDSIKLSARLEYNGKPMLPSGIVVEAVILKPGDDIGNMLSVYLTPDSISTDDVEDPAQQKYHTLLANDSSFYRALLPEEQIVTLTADSTGLFTGNFTQTELSGVYTVIYNLRGEIPMNGSFERIKTSQALFHFGKVEEEAPVVVNNPPAPSTQPKDTVNKVIKVRPKNKYGYYMGPGYKSKFQVAVTFSRPVKASASMLPAGGGNSNPYVTEIRDNLDGSYLFYIANLPARSNPFIEIKIRDEVLYKGKLYRTPLWLILVLIILAILIYWSHSLKQSNTRIYKIILWIIALILLLLLILQRLGYIQWFF
jgi:hypothetical protein